MAKRYLAADILRPNTEFVTIVNPAPARVGCLLLLGQYELADELFQFLGGGGQLLGACGDLLG